MLNPNIPDVIFYFYKYCYLNRENKFRLKIKSFEKWYKYIKDNSRFKNSYSIAISQSLSKIR